MATYVNRLTGGARVLRTLVNRLTGGARLLRTLTGLLTGFGRVANDALDRYELFISTDGAAFDFTTPDATSATLPIVHALGDGVHLLTVRRRNKWDLTSLNNNTMRVEVVSGDQVIRPGMPRNVAIRNIGGGMVRISAEYEIEADAPANRADEWRVWITTNGVDPDASMGLANDPEVANDRDGLARMVSDLGPYSDGLTIKTLVRLIRTSDGIQSSPGDFDSAETIASVVVETAEPTTPAAKAFYGGAGPMQTQSPE